MNEKELKEINPIILTDTETATEYTLEFTAETVKYAQKNGFNYNEIDTKPMVVIPELFAYAFRANHKNLAQYKIKELWDELTEGGMPDGFIERLVALYIKPMECLLSKEGEAKNSKVTVKF